MRYLINSRRVNILIGVILLTLGFTMTARAQTEKLAILPFKIHSDRDLTFLQKGIVDMLTSRLSGGSDKVTLIDRQKVYEALDGKQDIDGATAARGIGEILGADRLLFGSLTVLGDNVSIDARILEMAADDIPMPFFTQATTIGDVIPQIDLLAQAVNQKVFGRTVASNLSGAAQPRAPKSAEPVHPSRMHPEKLLSRDPEASVDPAAPAASAPRGGGFVSHTKDQRRAAQYWRSETLKMLTTGVSAGDLDGDGRKEIVVVSPNRLWVYRFVEGELVQIYESDKVRYRHYVGVDVADINGNGRDEVFISALSANRDSVKSSVLEFDDTDFNTLIEDSPWLYRVSWMADGKARLLGQKIKPGNPLSEPAFWLTWTDGQYAVRDQVTPANAGSVLGSAIGNLNDSGDWSAVVSGIDDAIRVLSSRGKILARQSGSFGNGMQTVNLGKAGRGEPEAITYLPVRVLIADVDANGRSDLVVIQNNDLAGNKLEALRLYTDAQVVGFYWEGNGLIKQWETQAIDGYIADLALMDLDGDGQKELLAAVVEETGSSFLSKPKSYFISFSPAS